MANEESEASKAAGDELFSRAQKHADAVKKCNKPNVMTFYEIDHL